MMASVKGRAEVARLLLEHGANVHVMRKVCMKGEGGYLHPLMYNVLRMDTLQCISAVKRVTSTLSKHYSLMEPLWMPRQRYGLQYI